MPESVPYDAQNQWQQVGPSVRLRLERFHKLGGFPTLQRQAPATAR